MKSFSELAHLLYSNGPAMWHGLPDIRHIKVSNGRLSAIFNLIEYNFSGHVLKPNIVFHSNGLAIRQFFKYYAY